MSKNTNNQSKLVLTNQLKRKSLKDLQKMQLQVLKSKGLELGDEIFLNSNCCQAYLDNGGWEDDFETYKEAEENYKTELISELVGALDQNTTEI